MNDDARIASVADVSTTCLANALRFGQPWLPEPANPWLLQHLFGKTSFVALEDEGQVAGVIIAMLEHECRPLRLYIDQVAVDTARRGRGLLGRLLKAAHNAGTARGAVEAWLTCHPDNPALATWPRYGYQPVPAADQRNGWPVHRHFKGQDADRVLFTKLLVG
jgi:GNAT superfamily N-acetyltransferase